MILSLLVSSDGIASPFRKVFLYSSYNNYGNAAMKAFFLSGISEGEAQAQKGSIVPPYFIVANGKVFEVLREPLKISTQHSIGFLKLYIVVVYEAQSFVGITYGGDAPGGTGPSGNRFCLWAG